MEIDAQGNAIWIVEGKGGAAKRWAICREHMNRILGDAMDDSSRGIESLGE